MAYIGLSGIVVVVALLLMLLSAKMLFTRGWFLGWLKGMLGVVFITIAGLCLLAALDIYSYKPISRDKSVATLSFTQLDKNRYTVSLVDNDGSEFHYELKGDLWQIDARILRWSSNLARVGLAPGYRLDRLSGRYVSLEKERLEARTVYELSNSKSRLDVWLWLKEYGYTLSLVDLDYGSATYLPMADGALFSVKLHANGLMASPLNERAKQAISAWE